MEDMVGSIIGQAAIVGGASLIAGSVAFGTACVVGGTYAAVGCLTNPFFEKQGQESLLYGKNSLLSFLTNTIITAGLVNLLGLSLKVAGVAGIALLPVIAMGKILLFGAVALGIVVGLGYLHSKAAAWWNAPRTA